MSVNVTGLDTARSALTQFPTQVKARMELAGKDAAQVILNTEGLRKYPPATERNAPGRMRQIGNAQVRMPYYIRGRGTMMPIHGGGYTQMANSERYGTKWYVRSSGLDTLVGNPVSYAAYLAGESQTGWAAEVGWRKLLEVANEKMNEIKDIYERHIAALINQLGL